jgi:hypothetical protein
LALGVGASGALIDVSQYIKGPEGVSWKYGRQDEFRDPSPGVLTFTLENQDGRFTPGNTSSPLATLLTEGTAVCWQLGTRLVTAVVSAIGFATSEDQWGRVQVTAGDVFYIANRTPVDRGLAAAMAEANAWLYWPLNDPAYSSNAAENNGGPSLVNQFSITTMPQFGVASTIPGGDPMMVAAATPANTIAMLATPTFATINYPPGSLGFWGFWLVPVVAGGYVEFDFGPAAPYRSALVINQTAFTLTAAGTSPPTATYPNDGLQHYVAVGVTYAGTTFTSTLYLDGVAVATVSNTVAGTFTNALAQPFFIRLFVGDGINTYTYGFAHLSHSPVLLHEELLAPTTLGNRLTALAQAAPLALGTVDANLSPAIVDVPGTGSNVWSMLCDALRTEQGHIYATTSGTVATAPGPTVVNFRARTRPATPVATFDAQADIDGLPQFVRDITNMFATVTATGPSQSVTVTDQAAIPRVGGAATSETVLLKNQTDLLGYAQDRLLRGENVQLRVAQVTIDTIHAQTPGVPVAVLGLVPGDRIRIANLPSNALGFTFWDGWFLGADELHAPGVSATDRFTLYLAPVLPATAVTDTDRVMSGGQLALTSSITSGATTMSVTSLDGVTFLSTTDTYTLIIDNEQVNLTACTTGPPQVATITRGANGTTAAAHAAGAVVELATPALVAF